MGPHDTPECRTSPLAFVFRCLGAPALEYNRPVVTRRISLHRRGYENK
jgi:hypothetical protein